MTKYFDTGCKSSRALDGGKVPTKALDIMICAEAQGTKPKKALKLRSGLSRRIRWKDREVWA